MTTFKNMDYVIVTIKNKEYLGKICGFTRFVTTTAFNYYIVEWYDKPNDINWPFSNIEDTYIRAATQDEVISHLLSVVEEAKAKKNA